MAGVPLIALDTFPYNGGTVVAGQAFLAVDTNDAYILTVSRQARYETKALTVSREIEPEEPALETPKARRPYRRRVLPDPAA